MKAGRKIWCVICVLSLLGCVICGCTAWNYRQQRIKEQKRYDEIRENVKQISAWWQPLSVSAEEVLQDETELQQVPVDFDALKEINDDIYAWITLPGTEIDYPVLQSEEEDFYLNHDVDRNESISGAIYSQTLNKKDFSDFLTVLYGHDMKDYSMFGSLLLLEEESVFQKNNVIQIYLPEETIEYRIFAAYVASSEHLLDEFDQESKLEKKAYLAEIAYLCKEEDTFDQDVFNRITTDDNILTLSTCYHGDKSRRFLVQAVRVN